jgi:hypothetical protein
MARPSGIEKRLISKHRHRERQNGNNSPPDEDPSERKFLFAPNYKTKKQKNHAESSSEGGSSGYLAAACMRDGPVSG